MVRSKMIQPLPEEVSVLLGEKILTSKNSCDEYRIETLGIASIGKKVMYMLEGESFISFCSSPDFLKIASNKLEKGCKLHLAFHARDAKNLEEAVKKLFEQNNEIKNFLSKTSDEFLNNLNFYLANDRYQPHFLASDNSIIIEGKHTAHAPRDVYIRRGSKTLSRKYIDYFKRLVNENKLKKIEMSYLKQLLNI